MIEKARKVDKEDFENIFTKSQQGGEERDSAGHHLDRWITATF